MSDRVLPELPDGYELAKEGETIQANWVWSYPGARWWLRTAYPNRPQSMFPYNVYAWPKQ